LFAMARALREDALAQGVVHDGAAAFREAL
jgi:hypothetical protein